MQKHFTLTKTTRAACFHLLSVALSLAIVLLFTILTYTQITLPHYTANHPLKDAQQVVNLLVAVVAAILGILLGHCLNLTNEAETAAELRQNKLTIPRLHTHVEASGGSKSALVYHAIRNRALWLLAALYLFAVIIFGVVNSVLSVIFVVDAVTDVVGKPMPVNIPLSADIPLTFNGTQLDTCRDAFADPGCTYDLALTSLSSQLVTNTQYALGGVTFTSPNGTMGLPFQALRHFTENVSTSMFEDEYRQYCLPVLSPHIITCKEEPFVQPWGETNSSLVLYKSLTVTEEDPLPPYYNQSVDRPVKDDIYRIVLNYQSDSHNESVIRSNDQGKGTMTIKQSPIPGEGHLTIVTASDSGGQGYASLLHHMMYGNVTSASSRRKYPATKFVAVCEIASLYNNTKHSSWKIVDFSMKGGVLRANVTNEPCPNPRYPGFSGFRDLFYAIEGAASILASTDGYTKLLNNNTELGSGTSVFANMSRLDAAMNKIYHIVQTSYSQTAYEYAMQNEAIYKNPITMTYYPHLYVIRISWTPTTWIGLTLAILIALTSLLLFFRWLRAIYRLGSDRETWNLLRPVDLMAYSLAAYQDLIHDLNTVEHREAAMRQVHGMSLKEYPIAEGMESLIGLVRSSSPVQHRVATPSLSLTAASPLLTSPVGTLKEKTDPGLGVMVEEAHSTKSGPSEES